MTVALLNPYRYASGVTDVTFASKLSGGETGTLASSKVTSSITFTEGKPYLVFGAGRTLSGNTNEPTLSGAGQTWTALKTDINLEGAARNQNVWGCIATGPTLSGALTIDFGGQTQQAIHIDCIEITGAYQSGTINDVIVGDQIESRVLNTTPATQFQLYNCDPTDSARNASIVAWIGDGVNPQCAGMTRIGYMTATNFEYGIFTSPDVVVDPLVTWTGAFFGTSATMEIRAAGSTAPSPIKRRVLDSDATGNNLSSRNTATLSPAANSLVLCGVMSTRAGGAVAPTIASNAGLNLVWVQAETIPFDTDRRLTLFRAQKASPGSGTATINWSAGQTGMGFWIVEFTGVVTTGTDGADAIRNIVTNPGTGTSMSVTLAAFNAIKNSTFGIFGWDVDTGLLPEAGFVPVPSGVTGDNQVAGEVLKLVGGANVTYPIWNRMNDTSVEATLGASADWAGIACELVAA